MTKIITTANSTLVHDASRPWALVEWSEGRVKQVYSRHATKAQAQSALYRKQSGK